MAEYTYEIDPQAYQAMRGQVVPQSLDGLLMNYLYPKSPKKALAQGITGLMMGHLPQGSAEKVAAYSESPLYWTMKPTERLALVKGEQASGLSPELMQQAGKAAGWSKAQHSLANMLGILKQKLIPIMGKHAAGD